MPTDSKITVLVARAAPFWLPAHKPTRTPALLLRPGANRVSGARWDLAKEHPTVALHVEHGTLKLDASASEVAAHTHAPDALSGLEDLSIEKARSWIEAATSLEVLAKWRTLETKGKNRSGMVELLDARSEAIASAEE